jgi:hypothetical protein
MLIGEFFKKIVGEILATTAQAAGHSSGPLTPFRNTSTRRGYTIDTVGDTLGQASPQNTRLVIRVFGPDEDRKVGHEENTGLPITILL